ncbi:hypothetical protein ACGCUP_01065 [Eubacteriales bacterium KG125]
MKKKYQIREYSIAWYGIKVIPAIVILYMATILFFSLAPQA